MLQYNDTNAPDLCPAVTDMGMLGAKAKHDPHHQNETYKTM